MGAQNETGDAVKMPNGIPNLAEIQWRPWVKVELAEKGANVTVTPEERKELTPEQLARLEAVEAKRYRLQPSSISPNSLFDLKNMMGNDIGFWLLMIILAKKGHVSEVKEIILSLFEGIFDGVTAYSKSSGANRITAWGAGRMNSLLLERFGLLTQAQAIDFSSGINVIAGFQIADDLLDLVPWKGLIGDRQDGFPDQLTIADTTYKVGRERAARVLTPVGKSITMEKKEG